MIQKSACELFRRGRNLLLQTLRPPAGLSEIHAQAAVPRPHAAERNLQCARGLSELPHLHWRSRYILALIIFAARVDVLVHHQNPSVLLWNQVQTESSGRNLGLLESERGRREQHHRRAARSPNFSVLNFLLITLDRDITHADFCPIFESTGCSSVFLLRILR